MTGAVPWRADLRVKCRDQSSARALFRVLVPEAEREVPRTRTVLVSPKGAEVHIRLEAADTGAVRAGVNTHLGWLALAQETQRAAVRAARPESRSS